MKIASRKNEKPSIAKPSPNTLPNVPVKFGHSRPISKLRIVPVTTPTANSADHHPRPAPRERPVELVARAQVEPLDEQHHRRERDPEADERDVHGERERLHLARLREVFLLRRRERGRDSCELTHLGAYLVLVVPADPYLGFVGFVPSLRCAVEDSVVAHQELEAAGRRPVGLVDGAVVEDEDAEARSWLR